MAQAAKPAEHWAEFHALLDRAEAQLAQALQHVTRGQAKDGLQLLGQLAERGQGPPPPGAPVAAVAQDRLAADHHPPHAEATCLGLGEREMN